MPWGRTESSQLLIKIMEVGDMHTTASVGFKGVQECSLPISVVPLWLSAGWLCVVMEEGGESNEVGREEVI